MSWIGYGCGGSKVSPANRMVGEVKVTYNAADTQKPDNHIHDFAQVFRILTDFTILVLKRMQILKTNVEVEDSANTDGAKEANIEGLPLLLDLVDLLVHAPKNGRTSQEKNQYAEGNKAIDGDDVVVGEVVPGADGTEPDKYGDVEEHVDGWLEGVVHCFKAEPVADLGVSCL